MIVTVHVTIGKDAIMDKMNEENDFLDDTVASLKSEYKVQ